MIIVYSTRRNWQKKYCSTNMMGFTMANSHVSICISLYFLQILLYFVVLKLFVYFIVFIFVFLLLLISHILLA